MVEKIKYRGPGFLSLLTLLFIGLKLCGVIKWSWFWVLSPKIIPLSILLICFILIGLCFLVCPEKERKDISTKLKELF